MAGLTLNTGENYLASAVLDAAGGYAYFGTYPLGRVVKVRLSDFTRVAGLTLSGGEDSLRSAAIDAAGGYAYFGTYTSPGMVIKVRLSDFTRVAGLTLNTGEDNLRSAAIDAAGGYVYFATETSPGRVVKVRLSDFTRVAGLTLDTSEVHPVSAVLDAAGGYAYFGTATEPGRVVKVRLSDFTRVAGLTLSMGENYLYTEAVIDAAGGYAYFGTYTTPGRVVRIDVTTPPLLVHADPTGACGGNTPCYTSLQTAIDTVAAGGEVRYYGGTYHESVTLDKNATLNFTGNSDVALDGSLAIRAGTFNTPAVYPLALGGNFTHGGGTFVHNDGTVVFDGSGVQNLASSAATAFHNLTVGNGVTLVETFAADNVTVGGTLTNNGVIRKTQDIGGAGLASFGLTGVQMDVAASGTLTSLQVERVDSNHPNATAGIRTGRYWTLTPNSGAGGYTVDLTLPHDGLADPTACRYVGPHWDCARSRSRRPR